MSSSMLLAWNGFRDQIRSNKMTTVTTTHSGGFKVSRCFFSLNASALQFVSSLRVTLEHLLTGKFHVCLISSASVLTFSLYEVNGHRLAANVSWAVISFVIIFPLTSSLSRRSRNMSVEHVATFKATLVSYFYGHRDWDCTRRAFNRRSKSNITRKERGRMLLTATDKVRLMSSI